MSGMRGRSMILKVAKELVGRSISSITTDRPVEIREALK